MNENDFKIKEIRDTDKRLISAFITDSWGSILSVSRGRIHDITTLPGFICTEDEKIIGLVTYNIENKDCEIVTLDCVKQNKGLGTILINKIIVKAKKNECDKVWLITTNDNTNAIRFYQKRGFEWVGFHKDAMKKSRELKPGIPETGNDQIPIKHEIEFELKIDK